MATPLELLHSIVQQAYDLQQVADDLLAPHADALREIDDTLSSIDSAIQDEATELRLKADPLARRALLNAPFFETALDETTTPEETLSAPDIKGMAEGVPGDLLGRDLP